MECLLNKARVSYGCGKIPKYWSAELSKLSEPLHWEGIEVSIRGGFYRIQARVSLDFEKSSAPHGNIYLRATGRSGRYLYLLGIDKESRDVFFHCWDRKRGLYLESGGRVHLRDYFEGKPKREIVLAIEWKPDGVFYYILDDQEEKFSRFPFLPHPEE
jgi:hypothetical protein